MSDRPITPAIPTPVIEVQDFRMAFGDQVVIDDLSFEVRAGETFGLLGSNGSGKTTTIRALLGIYQPTAGSLLVEGRRFDPAQGSRLGYLPEERGLYRKESVIEVMVYFGRLKGLSREQADAWSRAFLERVGLQDKRDAYPGRLSGGQKQRVAIARALAMEPEIMLFDEPTSALDPELTGEVLRTVRQLAAEHMTMLVVTHEMAFAREVAHRVLFMDEGVIVEDRPARDFFASPQHPRAQAFLQHML